MDTPPAPASDSAPDPAAHSSPPPVVPVASRGPISRKTFTQWLDQAAAVAAAESAPVLMVLDLGGLDDRHDDDLLDAAAWQLCETLGDEGLVCRIEGARLAVMVASDGFHRPGEIATSLLAALARPLDGFGPLPGTVTLGTAHWGMQGTTAEALFIAAAYALQDAHEAVAHDPEMSSPFEELTEKLAINQS